MRRATCPTNANRGPAGIRLDGAIAPKRSNTAAGPDRGDSSDLKSREYRGKDGEIHHHTRTYERDHPGKSR